MANQQNQKKVLNKPIEKGEQNDKMRYQCLLEYSTLHQIMWNIDSLMLRNPVLRHLPKD
jgi:hypothetical protein